MAHEYKEVVDTTLKELNATNTRTILVLNKVDMMDSDQVREMRSSYPDAIFVSAEQSIGLDELEIQIEAMIESEYEDHVLQIPMSKYKAVAFIHENANVEKEEYEGSDVELTFSMAEKDFEQLSHLLNTIGADGEVI
jgi:GTP-binding protein HflX